MSIFVSIRPPPLFTRPLAFVPWRQWAPPISRRPSRPPSSSGPSGPGTPSFDEPCAHWWRPPPSSSSIRCSSQFVQSSSPRPCTRRLPVSPPVFQVGVVFRFHPPNNRAGGSGAQAILFRSPTVLDSEKYALSRQKKILVAPGSRAYFLPPPPDLIGHMAPAWYHLSCRRGMGGGLDDCGAGAPGSGWRTPRPPNASGVRPASTGLPVLLRDLGI